MALPLSGKMARQAALAMEIPSMPLAGGVMGYYLDVYFRTSPKLTVAMTILGLIGAAIAVVRIAREFSSRSNDGQ